MKMPSNDFDVNGYKILKGFYNIEKDLGPFYKEIKDIALFINANFGPFEKYQESILTEKQSQNLYRALRYLPALCKLSCSEKSLSLCHELGLKFPVIMHSSNIRMDIPQVDKFLFHWHQDFTYLLGSLNSLTFWIPLTEVNKRNGSIGLIPGTHKSGVLPVNYTGRKPLSENNVMSPKDIHLQNEPEKGMQLIEASPGDLIVFSQLLLHKSTPNYSNKIRWVIQLRYADIEEFQFYENDYPFGDATNIFNTNYLVNKTQ